MTLVIEKKSIGEAIRTETEAVKIDAGGNKGFLNKLCKLMDNEEFRKFFHQYLNEWDDIKTSIMFMKLYACVEDEYYKRRGIKLHPDKITEIIKEMISDSECRKVIMKEMNDFMQDNTKLLSATDNLKLFG